MAECNKPDDLGVYTPPYDNPTDPVKIIENCTDWKSWITGTFRTWVNSAVEYVSCALEDIGLKKESVDKTKEQIDTIKSEIDVNLEAVKALCGTKWLGEWNDTGDFAQGTVVHNGVVYASLIVPPDTHIGDEPPSANWRKITFEVVDDTSPVLGGDLECANYTLNTSSYRQQADMESTATTTIDFNAGDAVKLTITMDTTLEFVNFVNVSYLEIDIIGGGDWTITYPIGTLFPDSRMPVLSTDGKMDRMYIERRGDGTFYVAVPSKNIGVAS